MAVLIFYFTLLLFILFISPIQVFYIILPILFQNLHILETQSIFVDQFYYSMYSDSALKLSSMKKIPISFSVLWKLSSRLEHSRWPCIRSALPAIDSPQPWGQLTRLWSLPASDPSYDQILAVPLGSPDKACDDESSGSSHSWLC